MIVEALIAGASLVGCAGGWFAVQKHRITAEMQKHKLNHDLEVLRPTPTPKGETPPCPAQQSLTALLERRERLENHITELRKRVCDYSEARFAQYRLDSLKALEDAREEQKELVLEETGLLEMMQEAGEKDHKRVAELDLSENRDLEGEAFDEQLKEAKQ